jgi:hypothetical protein
MQNEANSAPAAGVCGRQNAQNEPNLGRRIVRNEPNFPHCGRLTEEIVQNEAKLGWAGAYGQRRLSCEVWLGRGAGDCGLRLPRSARNDMIADCGLDIGHKSAIPNPQWQGKTPYGVTTNRDACKTKPIQGGRDWLQIPDRKRVMKDSASRPRLQNKANFALARPGRGGISQGRASVPARLLQRLPVVRDVVRGARQERRAGTLAPRRRVHDEKVAVAGGGTVKLV